MIFMLNIIKTLGYFGIFLISRISTSTIFLPFPLYLLITTATALGMNPILVSIVSALGMSLGEFTSYFIGLGSRSIIEKKHKKTIKIFENFFKKYGIAAVSIFAFLPFPFDVIGIMAGIGKQDIKKFFIATFIGKFFKALFLSYAGYLMSKILWQFYF